MAEALVKAQGAREVYRGFLLGIIALALVVAGAGAIVAAFITSLHVDMWMGFTGLIVIALVGFVLAIVGFLMVRRGFATLRGADRRYGVGYTGTTLIIVAWLLLIIAFALLLAPSPATLAASSVLAMLGFIVSIAGAVMMAIGLWRLGEEADSTALKVGAILWIVGVVAAATGFGSILAVIGAILVAIGAKQASETLQARAGTASPTAPGAV